MGYVLSNDLLMLFRCINILCQTHCWWHTWKSWLVSHFVN